jgi:hypothetical protein
VYSTELGERFAAMFRPVHGLITHPDPEAAVGACFGTLFAATIIRVAYGAGFATPPVDDDTFTADLGETAARYLLARPDMDAGLGQERQTGKVLAIKVATVEINILTAKQQREYVSVDHHVLHLSPRRAELIASMKGSKSSSPSVLPCSSAISFTGVICCSRCRVWSGTIRAPLIVASSLRRRGQYSHLYTAAPERAHLFQFQKDPCLAGKRYHYQSRELYDLPSTLSCAPLPGQRASEVRRR